MPHRKTAPGTVLVREWRGASHRVTCSTTASFIADDATSRSRKSPALITGTRWSGPLFFGLKRASKGVPAEWLNPSPSAAPIYTRKSSEDGLEQEFNSLHAQREACEAFIKSQAGEGWRLIKTAYDDGGLSGGTMERPALQRLLADIGQGWSMWSWSTRSTA